MKNNKKITFFLLFFAMGSYISAQDKKMMTLDEAVQLGITNSKYLKIDASKIEEATANLLEAKNRQLPDLKLSTSYIRLGNANVDLKFSQNESGNATKSPKSALLGQVNFSLPLYAGGKIKYGIESAKYLIEASKLTAENDQLSIAYNVSQAYNNLYKAKQNIEVLQDNLASSEKRDQSFLKLENNGIIPKNDRLKANLQTNTIELQLLEAENNYHIAQINMALLLGLPDQSEIEVDPEYISKINTDQPVEYFLKTAFDARKDMKAMEIQKKAASLEIKSAKAENLPTIGLTGGYIAAEVPDFLTITNAINIGVGVQYNLGNLWKKNSSLLKAQSREEQLAISTDMLTDQIKLAIYKDYQNLNYANKKIAVYEKASVQAAENLRITKNKYDNGLETITNLLDADAAQLSAKVNVLNAKADAALSYRKLQQSAGILIK